MQDVADALGVPIDRRSYREVQANFATFEEDTVYDQRDSEGFIKLNALRLRLEGLMGR